MVRRKDDQRGLTTLLFTDIVGSSEVAADLGDRRWGALQARHHAEVRKLLRRHGGQEVDTAGDGFFATFRSPAAGVRCAAEIAEAVRTIGLEVRAGLHIGEIERSGEKGVSGIAVSAAARVAAVAGAGQVVVTDTIVQLTRGSGLEFAELGAHDLKGVPGRWELSILAEVDGEPVASPGDPDDAREARLRAVPLEERRGIQYPAVAIGAVVGVLLVAVVIVALSARNTTTTNDTPPAPKQPLVALDSENGVEAFPLSLPQDYFGVEEDIGPIVFTGKISSSVPFTWVPHAGLAQINRTNGVVVDLDAGGRFRGANACACVAPADGYLWTPVSTKPRQPSTGVYPPGIAVSGFGLEGQPDRYIAVDPKIEAQSVLSFASDGNDLWIPDNNRDLIYHVDTVTSKVTQIRVPLGPNMVAAADGSAWLLDSIGGRLVRVTAAGRVSHPYPVTGDLADLTVGGGFVWVTDRTGQVWRIPMSLDGPATAIPVVGIGGRPASVAYDGGAIDVGFSDGTVAKIDANDPSSPTVEWTSTIGNQANSIAVADGVVWIAGHPIGDSTI